MSAARCPECEMSMHAVRVDELEVDRCDGCGAAWVSQARLRVRLPRLAVVRSGALSERRCPGCQAQMDAVRALGEIDLEACASCEGLYFDAGELRAVLDARRAADAASVGFVCVKCGGRFPMREGNALASGLACRGCTPQSGLTASERREANGEEIRASDVHSLLDLIEYLLQPRGNWHHRRF